MVVARALLLIAAAAAPLWAATPGGPEVLHETLHVASVILDTGCSGAVAESQQLIVTARHCIKGQKLQARLSTGATRTAWVVAVNEASDQAVLFLEEPAGVEPLAIARRAQIPGTVLYFEGNPGRPRFQTARLDRIDRCPSLPDLPNALFTGIEGVPGDSGAPLVDGAGRVVGLVHGGARCHIATPADTLARLVDGVFEREWVEHGSDRMPTLSHGRKGDDGELPPPPGPSAQNSLLIRSHSDYSGDPRHSFTMRMTSRSTATGIPVAASPPAPAVSALPCSTPPR